MQVPKYELVILNYDHHSYYIFYRLCLSAQCYSILRCESHTPKHVLATSSQSPSLTVYFSFTAEQILRLCRISGECALNR